VTNIFIFGYNSSMNRYKMINQTPRPTGYIDLGMGNPDFNLLPEESLRFATERAFAKGMNDSLRYGNEQGNGYFRASLADFLTQSLGEKVDGTSLFISTGASSALDLLVSLYTHPGDTILVENPTYFLALSIFADHGLRIVSIPVDDKGLDLDVLEEKLKKHQPKLLYTIPTFQNPSGHTLSLARRERLIELAEKHDFLIVADEVYHLLPYTENPPKPFALFAKDSAQVASVNSFSKILAPGIRLGWVQTHKRVMKKLTSCGLLESGGGMNPFTSAIVHELVEAGDLDKNIALLRKIYQSRLEVMDKALKEMLPSVEYILPQGGFFFWLRIQGQNTAELRQRAKNFKVDFRHGALFSAQKGMQEYMRLCFAFYNEDDIQKGVERLGRCLG
jgi:DNA-binding transcriptional MocR family regulator